ncbi:MAG TPA: PLD nuclease N-terminal domain-containing protein [Mycobacteriales bacterium]|jgi:hypothetical protein|nr:PLD nuclease N-terminal domain-containing protein [Mycobacteriales bacterium]
MTYLGGLTGLLVTGLWVFCVLDAVMSPQPEVRNLPKLGWIAVVLLFPLIGSLAWLIAGRPQARATADLPYKGNRGRAPWPSTRTAGFPEYERPRQAAAPEDDPDFVDRLRREKAESDAEHEDLLRRWEDDLRRREQKLRDDDAGPDGTGGTGRGPDPSPR